MMYNLRDLPVTKVSLKRETEVQKYVLNKLNLESLNQLRDKFEGVAFYNNVRSKWFSVVAIQEYLDISGSSIEQLPDFLDHGIRVSGKTIGIIDAEIYEPFKVPKFLPYDYLIFIYTSAGSRTVYLTGYLKTKDEALLNSLIKSDISAIQLKKYKGVIESWISLNQMQSLKEILKA